MSEKVTPRHIAGLLHSVGLTRETLTDPEPIDAYNGKRGQSNDRLKCVTAQGLVLLPVATRSGMPLDWLIIWQGPEDYKVLDEGGWFEVLDELDALHDQGLPERTSALTGNEGADEFLKLVEGWAPPRDSELVINGVGAITFIKRAYDLGDDLTGPGRYDLSDPIQQQLRHIKKWIEMAERDALKSRDADPSD
jgi:hypothetical protein